MSVEKSLTRSEKSARTQRYPLPDVRHASVQALEHDMREWIKTWNDDPNPFVWKKTAEEILDSLARYLQRVSGATAQNHLNKRTSDAGH